MGCSERSLGGISQSGCVGGPHVGSVWVSVWGHSGGHPVADLSVHEGRRRARGLAPSCFLLFCRCLWGESKLAKIACSGSLAPHFVNNDYVRAEIIYSTAHAHHETLSWPWTALCSTSVEASPGKAWKGCCVRLCYGCCISQERINMSYSSSSILPASQLTPCLPGVQPTVQTV